MDERNSENATILDIPQFSSSPLQEPTFFPQQKKTLTKEGKIARKERQLKQAIEKSQRHSLKFRSFHGTKEPTETAQAVEPLSINYATDDLKATYENLLTDPKLTCQ